MQADRELLDFYSKRYAEDDRLRGSPHGRLEFVRTQELLRRVLPPSPASVLDVGGGTGAHARWLAEDGYSVHVVDPVPAHVERAAGIAGATAALGDARDLDADAGSAGAVLLLGPLYHLPERDDRLGALREARRVVAPGGSVVVAAISRFAGLFDYAVGGRLDATTEARFRKVIDTGRHNLKLGFTTAHFHRPDELADEVRTAGFESVDVFGIEGPLAAALDAQGLERVDEMLPSAVACARLVEREASIMAASPHLLVLARA